MSNRHGEDTGVSGVPGQMAFEDVVELELVAGDPDYTRWLANARPQIDTAVAIVKWRNKDAKIDTLPGL